MSSLSKEELLFMAKACEQADRSQDMLFYAKQLILQASEPNIEERNLFSLAYRLNISEKKTSWRLASSLENKELLKEHPHANLVVQLRKTIEAELKELCSDCFDFIDNNLLKSYHTAQSRVFFTKLKGDNYRYLIECGNEEERSEVIEKCVEAYEQATEIAEAELKATDQVRLRLALHFAIFCSDMLGNGAMCKQIAKKAFDDALEKIDEIDDEDYKETTLTMQLLRDNIVLWTADPEEEGEPEQAEQAN